MAFTYTEDAEHLAVAYRMLASVPKRLGLIRDMRAIGERELKRISAAAWTHLNKMGPSQYQFTEHFKALSDSGKSAARLIAYAARVEEDNLKDERVWDWILTQYRGLDADVTALGRRTSKTQAKRRRGRPATDSSHDENRNDRIQKHHARLTSTGDGDATAKTGRAFGLSSRQIRRIVSESRRT